VREKERGRGGEREKLYSVLRKYVKMLQESKRYVPVVLSAKNCDGGA
jgi:hypothetical protein